MLLLDTSFLIEFADEVGPSKDRTRTRRVGGTSPADGGDQHHNAR
jgi:hypothetical protein